MSQGGLPGGHYQPLSVGQVERLHEAALTVLEQTGFQYENDSQLLTLALFIFFSPASGNQYPIFG